MHSVFLSYAREDHARAKTVAAALASAGLSVWWDRRLSAGSEYSKEIEQALQSAHVVVVLWSRPAVDSPWVRDEAAKGRDSGRLVPATLDGTEAPLGFGQFHTIDLSWRGWKREPLGELVAATVGKVGAATGSEVAKAIPPARFRPRLPAFAIGAASLAAVAAAGVYMVDLPDFGSRETELAKGGKVAIAGFQPVSNDPESRRIAQLAAGAVERTLATNFIETLITDSASSDALADADFRLRGTVDRTQDEITVLATIVDPDSGRTLWSTEVARPADEGLQLTEELAIYLADVIRCSTYTKKRMPNYDSAEVDSRIFRSCEAERSGGRQYDQLPAVSQALVDVAPESAQAWAYLANTAAFVYGAERRQQVYAAAKKKALQLDPENGAVRWGLAIVPDADVSLAERERLLREGLRLDPEFLWFRNHLGHLMKKVGRTEEAASFYQDFVSHYPLDHQVRTFAAYLHAQSGWMRRAREEFERIAAVRPWYRTAPIYAIRAEIFFGDPGRARRWMNAIEVSDPDRRCLELTIGALRSDRTPSADQIKVQCPGGLLHPAQVLAKFGHKEAAIAILAEEDPQAWLPTFGPFYVYEPDFAPIRADPRFLRLLVPWGIPQYWLETNKWPDFCREKKLPYDCREAAAAAVRSADG